MRMSDRFQKLSFKSVSDGLGGSISKYSLTDSTVYTCQAIQATKEYVTKELNIDLINPLVLITNELLDIETDFVLKDSNIYTIKSVNNVKNKARNSYILEEVGVFNG